MNECVVLVDSLVPADVEGVTEEREKEMRIEIDSERCLSLRMDDD